MALVGRSKVALIVCLRDRESRSFGEIAEKVGMSKNEVWNIYKRAKNPPEPLRRGRPRKLDPRDEITNAAELRSQLELAHAPVQTVQQRLRELMSTEHRAELLKNLILRLHDEDGWAFR
ncbi:unnamed protein product [Cylicocyclus nassatus]|uniref:Uncharacterized protein n=1 Tax=Cylicocyclus nassatus TaxID=53992 RepID=A0AA36MD10_CYLNA|nr:unnamed protein product [Cylicocyclus nassatus]